MTDEELAAGRLRWPRPVALTGLWLCAIVGIGITLHYLGSPPTTPTCGEAVMTRGDECAEVPIGTDTSGYDSVLGGADYDTVLAEQRAEFVDIRWSVVPIVALITIAAIALTVRVLIGRRETEPMPPVVGTASWYSHPIRVHFVGGVIGAVLFGGIAGAVVRHAGEDGFIVPDAPMSVQVLVLGLVGLGSLFVYLVSFPRSAQLIRADDTGLVIGDGRSWTAVPWNEITAVTDTGKDGRGPVKVATTHGGTHHLDDALSDRPALVRRLRTATAGNSA